MGFCQGSTLDPLLFITVVETVTKDASSGVKHVTGQADNSVQMTRG